MTTLEAAWVTALAVRPDGTLIAGTTPGGRVYTVDPKNGKSKLFATLDGRARLGAGARRQERRPSTRAPAAPGRSPPSTPAAARARLWDSGDKHVVSLLQADDKHLYAGTSRGGDPLQASASTAAPRRWPTSTPRRCARWRASGGALYVAVNDFEKERRRRGRRPGPAAATRHAGSPSRPPDRPPSAGALPRPGQRKAKAALYRIDPDGRMEQMFSIPDGYFTALAFDDDGRAYVGTGSEGRVYRVVARSHRGAGDRRPRAAGADAAARRQRLPGRHRRRRRHLPRRARGAAAGDLPVARARRRVPVALGPVPLARHARRRHREPLGQHRQARHDLDRLRAARAARARPAEGGVGQVASPPARYVQYRATFGAPEAGWRRSRWPTCRRTSARASPSSATADGGAPAPPIGGAGRRWRRARPRRRRRARTRPCSSCAGRSRTPTATSSSYRLAFRQENDAVWRPLGGPDPLTKTEYDWNTEGLPDGTYVVQGHRQRRALASRASCALDTTFTSSPILVDNRKPEVAGLAVKYPYVSGRARDDQSPLVAMEYVDRRRRLADPVGRRRHLRRPRRVVHDQAAALAPGPHAVAVRAWDSADNVGAGGHHDQVAGQMTGGRATTRPGCRPRPRSCRSRSACSRTSARSSTARRRAWRRSSIPAWEVDRLLREAERLGLKVELALITHTHNDHIEGVDELVREDGRDGGRQPARGGARARAPGARSPTRSTAATSPSAGAACARSRRRGHTVGGTCYLADGYVVTGDVLFVGGCGRTDFHGRRHGGDVAEPAAADAPARGDARLPGPQLRRHADLDDRPRDAQQPVPPLRDVRGVSRAARAQAQGAEQREHGARATAPVAASERLIVFLVGAIQFVNILDFMMVMPLGPDFARALGISTAHLGLIAGSYTAAAAVAGIVAARFLDRFDRRKALGVALFGLVMGTAAGALAHGLGSLVLARAIAGAFGGPATSISLSIIADVVPPARRGRAMGAVMGAFSVASVLGVPLGLRLAIWGGWRLPFIAVAAMGVVVVVLALREMPPMRGHIVAPAPASRAGPQLSALLGDRTIRLALAMNGARHADGVPRRPEHRARTCCRTSAFRAIASTSATWSAAPRASSSCASRAAPSIATAPARVSVVGTALMIGVLYFAFIAPGAIGVGGRAGRVRAVHGRHVDAQRQHELAVDARAARATSAPATCRCSRPRSTSRRRRARSCRRGCCTTRPAAASRASRRSPSVSAVLALGLPPMLAAIGNAQRPGTREARRRASRHRLEQQARAVEAETFSRRVVARHRSPRRRAEDPSCRPGRVPDREAQHAAQRHDPADGEEHAGVEPGRQPAPAVSR